MSQREVRSTRDRLLEIRNRRVESRLRPQVPGVTPAKNVNQASRTLSFFFFFLAPDSGANGAPGS